MSAVGEACFGLRECIACGWIGNSDECVWLGSIGPLCPCCHEVTESAEEDGT